MSRKAANDSVLEILPPVAGLVLLGFYFVPGMRPAVLWTGVAVVVLVVGWVLYRLAVRSGVLDANRTFALEMSAPMPIPARPKFASLHDKLRSIDWFQFEKLVCAVYQAKGYSVQRIGGAQPDGGVDLLIEKCGVKTIVQCKQWKKWKVGVKPIREFLGTLTDSKIANGIFVTLQGYTEDARSLAQKHNITLLALDDLLRLLEETDWKFNPSVQSILDDTRKFCPRCEKEMVMRTASKGSRAGRQFWGCSAYPRCRFVMNIY